MKYIQKVYIIFIHKIILCGCWECVQVSSTWKVSCWWQTLLVIRDKHYWDWDKLPWPPQDLGLLWETSQGEHYTLEWLKGRRVLPPEHKHLIYSILGFKCFILWCLSTFQSRKWKTVKVNVKVKTIGNWLWVTNSILW